MARKRKPEDGAALEDLGKAVFQNFTAAANSISQLYAVTEEQQKATFRAGEQHGLEKVRQWIISKQGEGFPVTREDISLYLQDELGYTTGDALMHQTSQSNQAQTVDMQMLAQGSSVQNVPLPQGSKQMKTFRSASSPTGPVRESPSFNVAQRGFFSENNLQIHQIGVNEMPAGNFLPLAFAQRGHLTQEEDLSDSLDSEMDMNIDEHP